MTSEELRERIGKARARYQKHINDVIIWCNVAAEGLEEALRDKEFLNQRVFMVPSSKPGKAVKRKPEHLESIIADALDTELYYALLVYLVGKAEAFLNDTLFEVLKFDPRRLLIHIQGISHIKKIEVSDIVLRTSRNEIIDELIKKELANVFYAPLPCQCEYMEKVLSCKLDDNLKELWSEIKAARDIIVHNNGVINDTYVDKAGKRARGDVGDTIQVDIDYFSSAAATMKSLIGRISSQLQKSLRIP